MWWSKILIPLFKLLFFGAQKFTDARASFTPSVPSTDKEIALKYIFQFVGQWYKWGGDDPSGFDCCLVGDTLVQTTDGFKQIKDFKGGETVKTITDGKMTFNKVVAVYNNGIKDVFRLRTTNSKIDCTANHRFLAVTKDSTLKGWSVLKSMKLEWKELNELSVGDIILMATNQNVDRTVDLDSNVLRFVGAMLGDGHICGDKNGFYLAFYNEEDREEFKQYLLDGFHYTNKVTYHETHGMIFNCSKTTHKLIELDICNEKSPSRFLPEWVFRLTNEQLSNFCYGYFSADGYKLDRIRNGKVVEKGYSIDSASDVIISQLHNLLLSRGFHVTNRTMLKRTKPIYIKGKLIKDPKPSHRFTIYDSEVSLYPSKLKNSNPYKTFNIENKFRFQTIRSIEHIGKQETYDLTIENSHNYFANGFVVHNSGLAIEYLKSFGKVPRQFDSTAQGLWEQFKDCRVTTPTRGCLVFWKDSAGKMIHVEIMLNERLAIGSSGGGSNTKTVQDAIEQNAFIKVRNINSRASIGGYIDPFKGG